MSNIELIDTLAEHAYERKARIDVDKMLAYLARYIRRSKDNAYDPNANDPINNDGLDEQDSLVVECVANFTMNKHSPLSEQEEGYAINKLQPGYVQFLKRALSTQVENLFMKSRGKKCLSIFNRQQPKGETE